MFDLHTLPTTINHHFRYNRPSLEVWLEDGFLLEVFFFNDFYGFVTLCATSESALGHTICILESYLFHMGGPFHFSSRCLSSFLFLAQPGQAWRLMRQYLPCMKLLVTGGFLIIPYHNHAIIMETIWSIILSVGAG